MESKRKENTRYKFSGINAASVNTRRPEPELEPEPEPKTSAIVFKV
jgi:hypothetical protein